jgi:MFS transporter, DHA1 family, inner membrane transport protein
MPPHATAKPEPPSAGTGTLILITVGICGIVTSVMMIGPLLLDMAHEFGVSLGTAGLLAAVAAAPQALGSPFAGLLSDRLGRRPLIVLAFSSVGLLGFAASAAPSLLALAAIRFLAGLLGSFAPTGLMASVGDLFPAGRRARAMGWFNMGFSLAAIAGVPLLSAIGGALGWRWAFATMGALLLGLALCVRLWFPLVPPVAAGTSVLSTYRDVWGVPGLLRVLGANLLERSMFAMLTLYLPAFLMLRYQMSAVAVAPALSIVALGTIAGNVLGGWLGDRLPKLGVFIASQLLAGVLALALFGLPLLFAAAVGIAGFVGLANAAGRPAFLAFGSELAPAQRGAMFGLIAFTNQSGLVLGSALGALVIQLGGYGGFAIAALSQGVGATALVLPLLGRPRRLGR